jgi:hypothetical protein
VNPGTADGVAGVLMEGAGRHATSSTLAIWEAALADLPEVTGLDGTPLAESVALDLVRHSTRFVSIAEFRGAYLARLPRTATPNRSDLPELEEAEQDADPKTAAEWMAHIRAQLAALKAKSTAAGLGPQRQPFPEPPPLPRFDQSYFEPEPEHDTEEETTP